MRVVLFCHSLRSDWNHGNAHFLRGIAAELISRGHDVASFEPDDGWSARHLVEDEGPAALDAWREAYPGVPCETYRLDELDHLDLDRLLDGADLVLVHEWTDPRLVARLGAARAAGGQFLLLFHDTHHRSATGPDELGRLPLDAFDGVLAFGEAVREQYLRAGWHRRVWTWHEAADVRVFRPRRPAAAFEDMAWIGNWGDDERTDELRTYLLEPVRELGLRGHAYGVRYPAAAIADVEAAGLRFAGRVANHRVPDVYACHRLTVHVPRRPYARELPGIPTIRVFEALACGIPLVCAPWDDSEGLFSPGADYLVARSGREMTEHMRDVIADPGLAAALCEHGLRAISTRHTCAHRVRELLAIVAGLQRETESEVA